MSITIGSVFLQNTVDSLTKAVALTEFASQELKEMFDAAMDAPGGKYEYSSTAIYRIAAMLDMVAGSLSDRETMLFGLGNASRAEVSA